MMHMDLKEMVEYGSQLQNECIEKELPKLFSSGEFYGLKN